MNTSTRRALIVASVVTALLMLLFGGGIATGTMMSGSIMRSGSIGPVSEILLPFLLFLALAVAVFSAIFDGEEGGDDNRTDS